jgi:hypothetical protein
MEGWIDWVPHAWMEVYMDGWTDGRQNAWMEGWVDGINA